MTLKEKQLLLIDLSARLPYGIIIYRISDNSTHKFIYSDIEENIDQFSHFLEYSGIDNIKPYLRPMSSMTEEEISDLQKINCQFSFNRLNNYAYVGAADDGFCFVEEMGSILDYLNSKHFDYRGLIEKKGLALEAPKGMYE